jgi:hypothetical protein
LGFFAKLILCCFFFLGGGVAGGGGSDGMAREAAKRSEVTNSKDARDGVVVGLKKMLEEW